MVNIDLEKILEYGNIVLIRKRDITNYKKTAQAGAPINPNTANTNEVVSATTDAKDISSEPAEQTTEIKETDSAQMAEETGVNIAAPSAQTTDKGEPVAQPSKKLPSFRVTADSDEDKNKQSTQPSQEGVLSSEAAPVNVSEPKLTQEELKNLVNALEGFTELKEVLSEEEIDQKNLANIPIDQIKNIENLIDEQKKRYAELQNAIKTKSDTSILLDSISTLQGALNEINKNGEISSEKQKNVGEALNNIFTYGAVQWATQGFQETDASRVYQRLKQLDKVVFENGKLDVRDFHLVFKRFANELGLPDTETIKNPYAHFQEEIQQSRTAYQLFNEWMQSDLVPWWQKFALIVGIPLAFTGLITKLAGGPGMLAGTLSLLGIGATTIGGIAAYTGSKELEKIRKERLQKEYEQKTEEWKTSPYLNIALAEGEIPGYRRLSAAYQKYVQDAKNENAIIIDQELNEAQIPINTERMFFVAQSALKFFPEYSTVYPSAKLLYTEIVSPGGMNIDPHAKTNSLLHKVEDLYNKILQRPTDEQIDFIRYTTADPKKCIHDISLLEINYMLRNSPAGKKFSNNLAKYLAGTKIGGIDEDINRLIEDKVIHPSFIPINFSESSEKARLVVDTININSRIFWSSSDAYNTFAEFLNDALKGTSIEDRIFLRGIWEINNPTMAGEIFDVGLSPRLLRPSKIRDSFSENKIDEFYIPEDGIKRLIQIAKDNSEFFFSNYKQRMRLRDLMRYDINKKGEKAKSINFIIDSIFGRIDNLLASKQQPTDTARVPLDYGKIKADIRALKKDIVDAIQKNPNIGFYLLSRYNKAFSFRTKDLLAENQAQAFATVINALERKLSEASY